MSNDLEQLVGRLRDLAESHPGNGAMSQASGLDAGIATQYYEVVQRVGQGVASAAQALDRDLQRVERLMTASVADLRGVENDAAERLQRLLEEVEDASPSATPAGVKIPAAKAPGSSPTAGGISIDQPAGATVPGSGRG